ncbi:MAG: hypothetical protein U0132_23905 [Gemmatimonadaceae bacterium]
MRRLLLVAAAILAVACVTRRDARQIVGGCSFMPRNVRLDFDTFAGIPTSTPLGHLRRECPMARLDTVGVGGTQPVALSLVAPGAVVSGVQTRYDAHGDSIHSEEPADLWVARGDSLRFPDGALIPTTVGALRMLDSVAVVIVDHGDDGPGSYVARCRYPHLALIVSNDWPTFADTGAVPFARSDTRDSTHFWRVELTPSIDSRIEAACPHSPAI